MLKRVDFENLSIQPDELLRFMGYQAEQQKPSAAFLEIVEELLLLVKRDTTVYGHYREDFCLSRDRGRFLTLSNSGLVVTGEQMVSALEFSPKVTLLLVTAGKDFDQRVEDFTRRGEITRALVIDALGSLMVEKGADEINTLVAREITEAGFCPTLRYSPGYGGWGLDQQIPLLDYLEAGRLGVTVSDRMLMLPVKSVSALIGWSHQPVAREYQASCPWGYRCSSCNNQGCRYRTPE